MLVVQRKRNESVVVDGRIVVTVVEIRGDKVRLGFQAPIDIPIFRSEIWAKRQKEDDEISSLLSAGSSDVVE